jgi:hypothetical protein
MELIEMKEHLIVSRFVFDVSWKNRKVRRRERNEYRKMIIGDTVTFNGPPSIFGIKSAAVYQVTSIKPNGAYGVLIDTTVNL